MQYKTQFETFLQSVSNESQILKDFRKNAFDNFLKIGYPIKRHENWRFTNLTSLIKTEYQFPNWELSKIDRNLISDYTFDNCHRIVFVNGIFDAELSTFDRTTKRIKIKNITKNFIDINQNSTKNDTNPFILLNKAFVSGGYYIEIDSN
jgi:Fe-S cluster assembly protein SufD